MAYIKMICYLPSESLTHVKYAGWITNSLHVPASFWGGPEPQSLTLSSPHAQPCVDKVYPTQTVGVHVRVYRYVLQVSLRGSTGRSCISRETKLIPSFAPSPAALRLRHQHVMVCSQADLQRSLPQGRPVRRSPRFYWYWVSRSLPASESSDFFSQSPLLFITTQAAQAVEHLGS